MNAVLEAGAAQAMVRLQLEGPLMGAATTSAAAAVAELSHMCPVGLVGRQGIANGSHSDREARRRDS